MPVLRFGREECCRHIFFVGRGEASEVSVRSQFGGRGEWARREDTDKGAVYVLSWRAYVYCVEAGVF